MSPTPHLSRRGLLAAGAASAALPLLAPSAASAASALAIGEVRRVPYTFGNAEIVGGGFVTGIVFNQSETGLVYARTDIGGGYRLDTASRRWIPLNDWVGWDEYGHTGIISIATDEVEPDRVYLAAGTYTLPDWDPTMAAILRSTDRGRTWQTTPLPFRLGGNMPGRGIGERLVIDPNRNRILYLGVRGGHGLWRSTDYGKTFAKVTSFPNAGNFVPDPNDPNGYSGDNQGVLQVLFDKRTGRAGRATRTLYVTVADTDNILYRSTDAGATWERVPGQPTGFIPHHAVFDHVGGYLYLATSNTAGPYDGSKGDVWKLDTATDTWTRISPVPSTSDDNQYGYSGLTIDRQNPDTLMVSTQIKWWPDCILFRSTDGGASWTRAWDMDTNSERTLRYDIDISAAPWLTWNGSPSLPEIAPKLGWMMESVQIDPFDSGHFMYGTGATIYGADNLTDWDSGGTVHISVRAQGLEETSIGCVISPPVGPAHLFSGVGDVGGFRHTDLNKATKMYDNPTFGATPALDYAELAPHTIVRVGNPTGDWTQHFGISTDSGDTWTPSRSEPSGVTGPGVDDQAVAISADGRRIVWSPAGAPASWSDDHGATWTASEGLPAGVSVRSDRVNPAKFYAYGSGVFYLSTDGGKSFKATAATGLPTAGNVRFKAVPGQEGDIWLAGGTNKPTTPTPYGMWRSTDSGSSFTRFEAVDEGDVVGFGKAAPGATYPAVYTSSKIDGVRGIFRSDDAGRTWIRINDDRHQYAWTGNTITGDPRIYGRVYFGTNGRGVMYGDPK
ncbi:xyloglucanase [Streptomyces sp. PSKA54]|uniref:Xyloglucanase n=1 Tax=Streptomyces himalayensis subsp. aureolus TaxID=2758039 RepID=A0A7W2D8C4_9ACTN|nr:sialidase family protein [Streptomyces himalayensis]MBA4866514.1 xyloglucanase [Streptomyces himalayensis subsp. aureolus]